VGGVTGDVLASESDRAPGGYFETDDQLEQSAFSGAVRADDGENFAIVDLHGHAIYSGEAAKVFRELIQLEDCH
jgi:hypothetical protein